MAFLWREQRRLALDGVWIDQLPAQIKSVFSSGSNSACLDALAGLALDPKWTLKIFNRYSPIQVELCNRWLRNEDASGAQDFKAFCALAQVLSIHPFLIQCAVHISCQRRKGFFGFVGDSSAEHFLLQQDSETICRFLLSMYRCFSVDRLAFLPLFDGPQIQALLRHDDSCVRYLAVKIICLRLRAADFAFNKTLEVQSAQGPANGPWDDREIDYRFLDLWETRKHTLYEEASDGKALETSTFHRDLRHLQPDDFLETTTAIGGVLQPSFGVISNVTSSLIDAPATHRNLESFGTSLLSRRPIVLSGLTGSGKTSLVLEAAKVYSKDETMLTLHLNEQTDAKLLIGMYTSAGDPGSFKWQPGVLTTAVCEGRWTLIEDLDRAPTEVISVILPLIERRQLHVANLGGFISAHSDFRLFATVRSSNREGGDKLTVGSTMLGIRHWEHIHLTPLESQDMRAIVIAKSPILQTMSSVLLDIYDNLQICFRDNLTSISSQAGALRNAGPHDLLKCSSRIGKLMLDAGMITGLEPVSEELRGNVFLEIFDCFAGSLRDSSLREKVADVLARNLQLADQAREYYFRTRSPHMRLMQGKLQIGRVVLDRRSSQLSQDEQTIPSARVFAFTHDILRRMEAIAATVLAHEPCLLVGETGTGKTAAVQKLADMVGKKLVVVNLSQQSESGDLLGGFKPLSLRSLALPLKEDFEDIFTESVNRSTNINFIKAVAKAFAKSNFSRLHKLWLDALEQIGPSFGVGNGIPVENAAKRQKLDPEKYQRLRPRWQRFSEKLEVFNLQLKKGGNGFAFHFVEGEIVKAIRSGAWVLLDEINLASPDTLESIADLLTNGSQEPPSLLLAETGKVEKVRAHPEFRIFAAMNPATDIGKKDLPQSLRSRFTEFYVSSPDRDRQSLMQIVESCLGDFVRGDSTITANISDLYMEIVKLEEENRLVDGANQRPHYSLRTLSRTLTYVIEIAPLYGLRRSVYEGFCMSFLTLLDRESGNLVLGLIERYILSRLPNRKSLMKQNPKKPEDGRQYVSFSHYWMRQGPLETVRDQQYIITPFIQSNLLNLVRAGSSRKFPVLLQGPTSSGKTSMVEYLAKISGNKFVRINNHEHTDLQEYLGAYTTDDQGSIYFQEGVLVRALKQGHWVVLDELNLAPTDVLEALNRLLDDNRELFVPETQEVVRPHENFMLFATQNPAGLYGGRKALSRAFRNRFLELHFDDIPEDELQVILEKRTEIAPSFCRQIIQVYKDLTVLRQANRIFEQKNSFATLRDLFRWAYRKPENKQQLAIYGYMLLAERVRAEDERKEVKEVIRKVMNISINTDDLYSLENINTVYREGLSKEIVWTKSMRRMFVLVDEALKRDEPVLLIGGTGCGKTTVCQLIAELADSQLNIVNAHQNTETGDLIGAQRPIRNRAAIETQLLSDLGAFAQHVGAEEIGSLDALVQLYTTWSIHKFQELTEDLDVRIREGLSRYKALFEWSDGSLVQAMKNGHHFLLDEISLADDSVLERLNSVLESGRSLMLAEKGAEGSNVKASPGFQFLATMNPGGDFGKKELSPALRNRFTEIWVPPISSIEEMAEIAGTALKASRKRYAQKLVEFAYWFGQNFYQSSQISVREIVGWVEFLNITSHLPDEVAIVEGAALVYIDGIGANPADSLHLTEGSTTRARISCLSKLDDIFEKDLTAIFMRDRKLTITNTRLQIGDFYIKKTFSSQTCSDFSIQAATTKNNLARVLRALQLPKPILIEGNPGVGKTTLVAALSEITGVPLTRINLSEQTDLMDLFGSDVPVEASEAGNFAWRDAPFLQAMQRGEWVLLDEMNLASQSVLEGLNACLDHRGEVYVPELDQTFKRDPSFVLFAAQNPHSQGGGRRGLPASFVNRFTVVYADAFSPEDLGFICRDRFPDISTVVIDDIIRYVSELSKFVGTSPTLSMSGGPWEFNLRDILRWLQLIGAGSSATALIPYQYFEQMLFIRRFRADESFQLVHSNVNFDRKLVSVLDCVRRNMTQRLYQVGLGYLERNHELTYMSTMVTPCNMKVLEAIVISLRFSWPVLLVGNSGCGKTSLIRHLAATAGTDLVEFPLSSDMDTMDIIGGYEQMNLRRKVQKLFRRAYDASRYSLIESRLTAESKIIWNLLKNDNKESVQLEDLDFLLTDICISSDDGIWTDLLSECRKLTTEASEDQRVRFEWTDGMLIEALEEGKWLVLDNANLCNPSVLDRLNSLLEPNGVLTVNEHRTIDGSARVVRPHENFRLFLTMDPRHGELSRAMRNRCIELYVPEPDEKRGNAPKYEPSQSALFRLKDLIIPEWEKIDSRLQGNLFSLSLDNLSYSDTVFFNSLALQLARGLHASSSTVCEKTQEVWRWYASAIQEASIFRSETISLYRDTMAVFQPWTDDLTLSESIYPLSNTLILSLSSSQHSDHRPLVLATILELCKDAGRLSDRVDTRRRSLVAGDRKPTSKIDRSLLSETELSFSKDATKPVGVCIAETSSFVLQWLQRQSSRQHSEISLQLVRQILSFLWGLWETTDSPSLDEVTFQMLLQLGHRLVQRALDPAVAQVFEYFGHQLSKFNQHWQLKSGGGMSLIWQALQQPVILEEDMRALLLDVKDVANQLDQIIWKTRASFTSQKALRAAVAQIFQMILNTNALPQQSQLLIMRLRDEISAFDLPSSSNYPYFMFVFQGLLQNGSLQNRDSKLWFDKSLSLFACRPTRLAFESPSNTITLTWLRTLKETVGIGLDTKTFQAIKQSFMPDLLIKIAKMSDISLGSMPRLLEEVETLKNALAKTYRLPNSSPLSLLNRLLIKLHAKIFLAHKQYLRGKIRAQISTGLKRLFKTCQISEIDLDHVEKQTESTAANIDQINEIFDTNILKSLYYLEESSNDRESLEHSADSWISGFCGFLLLYIPDKSFDPALQSVLAKRLHNRQKNGLQTDLESSEVFDSIHGIASSSPRTKLLKSRLDELESMPNEVSAFRPKESLLRNVQSEFNAILFSIVYKCQDLNTSNAKAGATSILTQNIERAIEQLENRTTYEDIIDPAKYFLQGLSIGLNLSEIDESPSTAWQRQLEGVDRSNLPFSFDRALFIRTKASSLVTSSNTQFDRRLLHLETVAVDKIVIGSIEAQLIPTIHEVFDSFHVEWKKRLAKDRVEHQEASSLYRYQGQNDDTDFEEELRLIFPEYDTEKSADRPSTLPNTELRQHDQQGLAIKLAEIHHQLFDAQSISKDRAFSSLLEKAVDNLTREIENNYQKSIFPLSTQQMLPTTSFILEKKLIAFTDVEDSSRGNFYRGRNPKEATRVLELSTRIRERFEHIHSSWPEQAGPSHVLNTVDELFNLRNDEPIAKILIQVETLQKHMYQWEQLASREYSANTLLKELTALLVSWRRLELSTWAKLLDMEDEKCEADAKGWWFVAYETIVTASLSAQSSGESFKKHVSELVMVLSDFMSNTSIGQFSHRLCIISDFALYASHLGEHTTLLKHLEDVLATFVAYFRQFEATVHQYLKQQRTKLDKAVQELIVLSSWKDTNIESLRASAKSSHTKLFKIVRKYRSLLSESAGPFLQQIPETINRFISRTEQVAEVKSVLVAASSLHVYQKSFNDWNERPDRFRNPSNTLELMVNAVWMPRSVSRCVNVLDTWTTNIEVQSKKLRSETPSELSEENRSLVQSLKGRKRRLLADVLKDIRLMGLKTNLDVATKTKQDSITTILSNSPNPKWLFDNEMVSHDLFRFFENLIKAQARNADVTEELTKSELERCLIYLQGFADILLKQRHLLYENSLKLQELDTLLVKYSSISKSGGLSKRRSEESRNGWATRCSWIPVIANFVSTLIDTLPHMSIAQRDDVKLRIERHISKFSALGQKLETIYSISDEFHLVGMDELEEAKEIQRAVEDLKSEIEQWRSEYPSLHFILNYFEPWTEDLGIQIEYDANMESNLSLDNLDRLIQKNVDGLLLRLQKVRTVSSNTSLDESEKSWLVNHDKMLQDRLEKFSIDQILSSAQAELHVLNEMGAGPHLKTATAMYGYAQCFYSQFREIFKNGIDRVAELHSCLIKTALMLSNSFRTLQSQGFCGPQDKSESEVPTGEKLEEGTGLGDGEGAQDISKDIQDDEDLSELAQGEKATDDRSTIEGEEDAVDMADQDLEGQLDGESEEKQDDVENGHSGDEGDDPEEHIDEIQDDSEAIDEKLWNADSKQDEDQQKKDDGTAGQKNEEMMAQEGKSEEAGEEIEDEVSDQDLGEDDTRQIDEEGMPSLDPELKEEEKLELPEDMNLDGDNSDVISDTGNSDGMLEDEADESSLQDADGVPENDENGVQDNSDVDVDEAVDSADNEHFGISDSEDAGDRQEQGDAGVPNDSAPDVIENDQDQGTALDVAELDNQEKESSKERNFKSGGNEGQNAEGMEVENQNESGNEQTEKLGKERGRSKGQLDDRNQSSIDTFKKLGDALDEFQKRFREIQEAADSEREAIKKADGSPEKEDVEHVPDENAEFDAQALGSADDEQLKALDKTSMDIDLPDDVEVNDADVSKFAFGKSAEENSEEEERQADDPIKSESKPNSTVGPRRKELNSGHEDNDDVSLISEKSLQAIDDELSEIHLSKVENGAETLSIEDAQKLWQRCEATTHNLSLSLTEQLRLILAPTLATKMRGDFRTGKRLNIKRIIPYIASQYKRDKIWMRRSIPSKRSYQIMIAIDDSQSMDEPESGSANLAFETLALVSRSLNMLEAGQLCIVGFGEDVKVAHPFNRNFTSASGGHVLRQLTFQQAKTDVKRLMNESLTLFGDARVQAQSSGTDLWQLELIISDGIFEDHESIQRLIRRAHQERIMVVFVVVDALNGQSIQSLQQASFEPNPTSGQPDVRMKRYLDGFPFDYYLIVSDVRELPAVLANALRQWFSEIVDM